MSGASGRLRRVVLAAHGMLAAGLPVLLGLPGAVLALPLLLPLPGLWRGRPYTYAASSLLVVLYAGGLLMEGLATPDRRAGALVLATVAVAEFCALLLFVRAHLGALRAQR